MRLLTIILVVASLAMGAEATIGPELGKWDLPSSIVGSAVAFDSTVLYVDAFDTSPSQHHTYVYALQAETNLSLIAESGPIATAGYRWPSSVSFGVCNGYVLEGVVDLSPPSPSSSSFTINVFQLNGTQLGLVKQVTQPVQYLGVSPIIGSFNCMPAQAVWFLASLGPANLAVMSLSLANLRLSPVSKLAPSYAYPFYDLSILSNSSSMYGVTGVARWQQSNTNVWYSSVFLFDLATGALVGNYTTPGVASTGLPAAQSTSGLCFLTPSPMQVGGTLQSFDFLSLAAGSTAGLPNLVFAADDYYPTAATATCLYQSDDSGDVFQAGVAAYPAQPSVLGSMQRTGLVGLAATNTFLGVLLTSKVRLFSVSGC